MSKKYYKITDKNQKTPKNDTIFQKYIKKLLFCIFPVQNPDFEEKFDDVDYWFVEFENTIPTREIGFNKQNQAICKMPFQENFGFWTDSNMQFSDFSNTKNFGMETISQEIFEEKWHNFAS